MRRLAEIQRCIERSCDCMLERFERNGRAYPFADLKFDARTGRDFDETDEPIKRRDFIYGWIQGRALESLANHADYFERRADRTRTERLDAAAEALVSALETIRQRNGGRLYFAMKPDGTPRFPVAADAAANYTDLFYVKGLHAVGTRLKNGEMCREGRRMFDRIVGDIEARRFRSDQILFDARNQAREIPGKYAQGPMMIALGGAAEFGDLELAARFIDFLLRHHVNSGQWPELERFDFVEALDAEYRPWRDREGILCDPGHALEFIGLAGKCLLKMADRPEFAPLLRRCGEMLPELFLHVFDQGWQPACGLMKCYNLTAREAWNNDMPWWNLPEAIRAGVELCALYPERCARLPERIDRAVDALLDCCIAPGSNGFACQTRNIDGRVVPVIPAVPDLDPGYHTNLALIDALKRSSSINIFKKREEICKHQYA